MASRGYTNTLMDLKVTRDHKPPKLCWKRWHFYFFTNTNNLWKGKLLQAVLPKSTGPVCRCNLLPYWKTQDNGFYDQDPCLQFNIYSISILSLGTVLDKGMSKLWFSGQIQPNTCLQIKFIGTRSCVFIYMLSMAAFLRQLAALTKNPIAHQA